jgi:hypothetical protein
VLHRYSHLQLSELLHMCWLLFQQQSFDRDRRSGDEAIRGAASVGAFVARASPGLAMRGSKGSTEPAHV